MRLGIPGLVSQTIQFKNFTNFAKLQFQFMNIF